MLHNRFQCILLSDHESGSVPRLNGCPIGIPVESDRQYSQLQHNLSKHLDSKYCWQHGKCLFLHRTPKLPNCLLWPDCWLTTIASNLSSAWTNGDTSSSTSSARVSNCAEHHIRSTYKLLEHVYWLLFSQLLGLSWQHISIKLKFDHALKTIQPLTLRSNG